jgi:hypothetical protein
VRLLPAPVGKRASTSFPVMTAWMILSWLPRKPSNPHTALSAASRCGRASVSNSVAVKMDFVSVCSVRSRSASPAGMGGRSDSSNGSPIQSQMRRYMLRSDSLPMVGPGNDCKTSGR